jgi:hypothetical protein
MSRNNLVFVKIGENDKCTNVVQLRNIGEYLYKAGFKGENKMSAI